MTQKSKVFGELEGTKEIDFSRYRVISKNTNFLVAILIFLFNPELFFMESELKRPNLICLDANSI